MLSLDMNPATIVIGLLLVAGMVLAVRRLMKRGTCDCRGQSDATAKRSGCAGCAGCGAVDSMVANMECQVSGK